MLTPMQAFADASTWKDVVAAVRELDATGKHVSDGEEIIVSTSSGKVRISHFEDGDVSIMVAAQRPDCADLTEAIVNVGAGRAVRASSEPVTIYEGGDTFVLGGTCQLRLDR